MKLEEVKVPKNTELKEITVKEWLELIPFENARKWALENYDPKFISEYLHDSGKQENLHDALCFAFHWHSSPQGHRFWANFYSVIWNMKQSVKLK